VIIMPKDAPAAKIAATRGYGAEVILYDRDNESREEIGAKISEERGLILVRPYDDRYLAVASVPVLRWVSKRMHPACGFALQNLKVLTILDAHSLPENASLMIACRGQSKTPFSPLHRATSPFL